MHRELILSTAPIDEAALLQSRAVKPSMGAVLTFLGYVRDREEGRLLEGLHYEAFDRMVIHQFNLLFDQVAAKWPVDSMRVYHRTGFVAANEPSLWLEVIGPHRAEAFAAGEFLISEMKKVVPIWKQPVPKSASGAPPSA